MTHDRRRITFAGVIVITIVAAAVIAALLVGQLRHPTRDRYTALGDSYTAGVAIRDAIGEPETCFRSPVNYPRLTRAALAEGTGDDLDLVDVSCTGATLDALDHSQTVANGATAPAQFDAVTDADRIVSIGIGANDIAFARLMEVCIRRPTKTDCATIFTRGGSDAIRARITAFGPSFGASLEEIHRRAPSAKVFVVGYPTIVPADGRCDGLDLPGDNLRYLAGVFRELNRTLEHQARAHDAVFVDTATSSVGHDLCAGSAAWINGPTIPKPERGKVDGLSLHPNAAGAAHTATLLTAAIRSTLDPGPTLDR